MQECRNDNARHSRVSRSCMVHSCIRAQSRLRGRSCRRVSFCARASRIVALCISAFVRLTMYSDLDDFLADLDARGLLTRVGEPVSPGLEVAAVPDKCGSIGGGGALTV